MTAQDPTISTFLEKWENSKTYLVQIAEAMPESKYGFKPTERQMSFEEQMLHIIKNINWLGANYFNVKDAQASILENQKERIKQNIENSFSEIAYVVKQLETKDLVVKIDFFTGKKTKLQMLNLLQDHVTHHRGQLIVYLNLNEIEPPRYVGW